MLNFLIQLVLLAQAQTASEKWEYRCGWVDNPTPGNFTLTDKEGMWTLNEQGGHQAQGDLPDFSKEWVRKNRSYGYGCACMNVVVQRDEKLVLKVEKVKILKIAKCKADKSLSQKNRD